MKIPNARKTGEEFRGGAKSGRLAVFLRFLVRIYDCGASLKALISEGTNLHDVGDNFHSTSFSHEDFKGATNTRQVASASQTPWDV